MEYSKSSLSSSISSIFNLSIMYLVNGYSITWFNLKFLTLLRWKVPYKLVENHSPLTFSEFKTLAEYFI